MNCFYKLMIGLSLFSISLPSISYASEIEHNIKEDSLLEKIENITKEKLDGKIIYDLYIENIDDDKNFSYSRSNQSGQSFPSASTIKIFIGSAVYDAANRGEISLTKDIREDVRLSLNESDNKATNRLIDLLGFDRINEHIKEVTDSDSTRLNRKMLARGPENETCAKDLAKGLKYIYSNGKLLYLNNFMLDSTSRDKKLLKYVDSDTYAINKSGELSKLGIENDLALIDFDNNTYIIVLLSRDTTGMGEGTHQEIIADFGKEVYEILRASDNEIEVALEEMEEDMDPAARLAQAIYDSKIKAEAAKLLIKTSADSLGDNLKSLEDLLDKTEGNLARGLVVLANLKGIDYQSEDDLIINLINTIYGTKEVDNRDLSLAIFRAESTLKSADFLLKSSPHTTRKVRPALKRLMDRNYKNLAKAKRLL